MPSCTCRTPKRYRAPEKAIIAAKRPAVTEAANCRRLLCSVWTTGFAVMRERPDSECWRDAGAVSAAEIEAKTCTVGSRERDRLEAEPLLQLDVVLVRERAHLRYRWDSDSSGCPRNRARRRAGSHPPPTAAGVITAERS